MIITAVLVCVGLLAGFVLINWTTCKKIIYKFPTLANMDNTTYRDDEGKCYKYYAVDMACPTRHVA